MNKAPLDCPNRKVVRGAAAMLGTGCGVEEIVWGLEASHDDALSTEGRIQRDGILAAEAS